jgi:hypothetical protein
MTEEISGPTLRVERQAPDLGLQIQQLVIVASATLQGDLYLTRLRDQCMGE